MTFSLRRRVAACAAVCLTVLLAGCGKNSEQSTDATLSVINLAPESGAIGVQVDDNTPNFASGVAYKSASASGSVHSGARRIRISNAGGVILDQSLTFGGQRPYLLVVAGGASSLGMSALSNDIPASSNGKSKLRLANVAVGLGPFDLYVNTASEDYRNVEPKVSNTSGTIYEVDVGTYTVRLTAPGTKELLFEAPAKQFADRTYYNLVLYNEGSGQVPSGVWTQQDSSSAPEVFTNTVSRVRAVNSQPGSGTVNVNVDATRVFTNVPFGGVSGFTRAVTGSRSVTFSDTVSNNVIASLTDTFAPSTDYSVFLAPGANGSPTAFRVADKLFPPGAGRARVRLVNATNLADVGLALAFSPITPNIAARSGSAYFELTAGTGVPVTVTQGAAGTAIANSTTDLTSGKTYTFILSGTSGSVLLSIRQDN